ncbi:hypothetical protein ACHWQZ_G005396 [Mnemiopsis leidyi]
MKENYQEAYKHYLATTMFISSEILKGSSSKVWCDNKTEQLLDLALKCIEAAKQINGKQVEQEDMQSQLSTSLLSNTTSSTTVGSTLPQVPDQECTTEPDVITADTEENDSADLLSILDSLPDVPANKPGQKYQKPLDRSATLPSLRSPRPDHPKDTPSSNVPGASRAAKSKTTLPPNYFNQHLPPNYTSQSLPRHASQPPPSAHNPYFSSPLGSNLGGTLNSPVVLKVSPMDQARQKNAVLAAQYERRAAQGRVNPRWRLDLARAQEENLNIARELEKTLARKAEQRKLRLEQEALEEETEERSVGSYEAILYCKTEHIRKFAVSVKEYDTQRRIPTDPDSTDMTPDMRNGKMESTFSRCFQDKSHPLSTAVGNAQYNFYNRIVPLNKKIYMASTKEEKVALLPGIQTEVEAITSDVSEFVSNLNVVLHRLYPIFDCEEGCVLLQNKLSDMFYKPFLAPLLETYNFLKEEEMAIFRKYLARHSGDEIQSFPNIKQKYHLGKEPYKESVDCLLAITETSSPITKFKLLISFAETICSCVKDFYLQSGMSEEEATDLSCLGADDLMPISIYIITRAGKPELLSELEFLNNVTNMEDLNGQEGYCLATVQSTFANIIYREQEKEMSSYSVGDHS